MALLTSWHKSRYFDYSGPGSEGDARFVRGECAMLTGASSLYALLKREPPGFVLPGESPPREDALPYHPTAVHVRSAQPALSALKQLRDAPGSARSDGISTMSNSGARHGETGPVV
jgi:hypothetical protein